MEILKVYPDSVDFLNIVDLTPFFFFLACHLFYYLPVLQKLKTGVMKKTVNPVWNEDLTLAVKNASTPIKLVSICISLLVRSSPSVQRYLLHNSMQEVFDKDTFSKDDQMGDAEFDIEALMQIIQMDLEDIRSGTVVRTVRPGSHCCLADESHIIWENGQVVQDLLLKLRNVETGVVHLQLRWVSIPGNNSAIALLLQIQTCSKHSNLPRTYELYILAVVDHRW